METFQGLRNTWFRFCKCYGSYRASVHRIPQGVWYLQEFFDDKNSYWWLNLRFFFHFGSNLQNKVPSHSPRDRRVIWQIGTSIWHLILKIWTEMKTFLNESTFKFDTNYFSLKRRHNSGNGNGETEADEPNIKKSKSDMVSSLN